MKKTGETWFCWACGEAQKPTAEKTQMQGRIMLCPKCAGSKGFAVYLRVAIAKARGKG